MTRRCKNVATTEVDWPSLEPDKTHVYCDDCVDGIRVTMRQLGIDPDGDQVKVVFKPCATI